MANKYYRDSFFPTKHIENLPKKFIFSKGTKHLVIEYATTDQLKVYKELIKNAAVRGDNIGVDEYSDSDIKTELLFDCSEIFQATDPGTGSIEAVMFIQSCLYQRNVDSCSATVCIVRSNSINDVVYAELSSLMGDFALALDIGYTQICVQVAFCFTDLYLELRKQGFVAIIVLPDWIKIAGNGVCENVVMVKQSGATNRAMKSEKEILEAINSFCTPEKARLTYFSNGCLPVPILPLTAKARNGIKFTFRNARMNEDEVMYKMLTDAASDGDGFTVDEYPTLDCFRMLHLAGNYAVIIEEEATGAMAGIIIISMALQYRRTTGSVSDISMTLAKSYRGAGLGRLVVPILESMEASVGITGKLGVGFSTNKTLLNLWKSSGYKNLGIFPNGAYQKGYGWIDLVYVFEDLGNRTDTLRPKTLKGLGSKL